LSASRRRTRAANDLLSALLVMFTVALIVLAISLF